MRGMGVLTRSDERLARLERRLEGPMTMVALLIVPALLLEDYGHDAAWRAAGHYLNWGVWVALCLELAARLAIAPRPVALLRRAWLDVGLILLTPPFMPSETLQGTRVLRAARALRVLRAGVVLGLALGRVRGILVHRGFHYVALVGIGTVLVGAAAILAFEGGANPNIGSLGDAIWWAIVTTTTVGYGDISPSTVEGRIVAVVLMLVGIGVIGAFTATVASFLMEHQPADGPTTEQRLERIEAQLAQLHQLLAEGLRDDGPGQDRQ